MAVDEKIMNDFYIKYQISEIEFKEQIRREFCYTWNSAFEKEKGIPQIFGLIVIQIYVAFLMQKEEGNYTEREYNPRLEDYHGEVFIVERLENGAGYCNYLSGRIHKDVPCKALIEPFLSKSELYRFLTDYEGHLSQCTSSCYNGLRDFYNQQYHGILDGRLGLDLARITYNKNVFIDFSSEYWKDYLANLANSFDGAKKVQKNLYTIVNRGKIILIVHPFWIKKYINELKKTLQFDVDINIIEVAKIIRE